VKTLSIFKDHCYGIELNALISEAELNAGPELRMKRYGDKVYALKWNKVTSELVAFEGLCTHEFCPLQAVCTDKQKGFRCDCHGGFFDENGEVKRQPPQLPLNQVSVVRKVTENGAVWLLDAKNDLDFEVCDAVVVALDICGAQKLIGRNLSQVRGESGKTFEQIPLLRTTDVAVVRMSFNCLWQGPDSGVFDSEDFLDNFFCLNKMQEEFKVWTERGITILECHIGDSELVKNWSDGEVFEKACETLNRYWSEFNLNALLVHFSCVLRHHDVFPLFAPGDAKKLPPVAGHGVKNLFMAGDWIRTNNRSYFMERAATTGLEAASAVCKMFNLSTPDIETKPRPNFIVRSLACSFRLAWGIDESIRKLMNLAD
jgi:nitrite reductase/ring-hydroxylating ferredoxin subunit